MPKDDSLYLGHMLDIAREALEMAGGKTRVDYDSDKALRVSLTHFVQVIGEAARQVGPETRAGLPDIPWADIVGMRHKIVHDYADVDYEVVWEVVTGDLPMLVEALGRVVPPEDEGPVRDA